MVSAVAKWARFLRVVNIKIRLLVSSSASKNGSPLVVWAHIPLMLMYAVVDGSGGRIVCLSLYILSLHDCKVGMCSTSYFCYFYFVTLLFCPLHQSGKDLSLLLKLSN